MNDTHVSDLLPGYSLDCLETEAAMRVAHHLTACAQCREELAAFRAVVEHLALAVPDVKPPDGLKHKVLRAIQSEIRPQFAPLPLRGWWRRLQNFFHSIAPAPAWNLASIVLIVGLGIATALFWQRASSLEQLYLTQDFHMVKLQCTHIVPEAAGQLVMSKDGEIGALSVAHLPELGAEQVYQVWLTQNGERLNGGTFTVNAQGYGVLKITSPQSGLDCGIHLTIEPEQGSGQPTGETVLQMMI